MPVAAYEVTTEVQKYPGITGWHYVTLPADVVDDIRFGLRPDQGDMAGTAGIFHTETFPGEALAVDRLAVGIENRREQFQSDVHVTSRVEPSRSSSPTRIWPSQVSQA